jgi:hypothetical protein
LINGAPQVTPSTANHDDVDLVEVPHIASPILSFPELVRIQRTEVRAPLPDGFIGDNDAAFGEDFFDTAKAQGMPVVKPDAVGDDLGWEAAAMVQGLVGAHGRSVPEQWSP